MNPVLNDHRGPRTDPAICVAAISRGTDSARYLTQSNWTMIPSLPIAQSYIVAILDGLARWMTSLKTALYGILA